MIYLKLFEEFQNEHEELEIKKSTIPEAGKGLFTLVDIDAGDYISEFTGDVISEEDSRELEGERGHYLISMNDGSLLDVYDSDCPARFANDAKDERNNSEIQEDDEGRCWLVATSNIHSGEEIFCSYGEDYWENWQK
jgi:SET domain-containing protein